MKVYLDNSATTRPHPKVVERMLPYLNEHYGNPSSIHSFGRKARVAIEESREFIADFINANSSEIYFTSCGTESTNLIINGIAETEYNDSQKNLILSTKGDHKATLLCIDNLVGKGHRSKFLELDSKFNIKESEFTIHDLSQASLISLIHVNNETGTIYDINKIRERFQDIHLHIDAVQSFGKIKLDVNDLGIHALSASAHKLFGPKGIGLAYVRSGTPMSPLFFGGGQERNRRAGTENVASIVGFAEAVRLAKENMSFNFDKVIELKDYLWKGLLSENIRGIYNNSNSNCSPYILSISFDPDTYINDSEAIIMFLDINGIAVSSGSACASGTLKPSHVILAGGYSEDYSKGTIRLSFSPENSIKEMDYTIEIIKKLANKIRK